MKNKIFILILIMVLSVCFIAGCDAADNKQADAGQKTPDNNFAADESSNGEDEQDKNAAAAESIKYAADYLPDKTFDGYEFRIVAPLAVGGSPLNICFADVEEQTGDPVDDAIYIRNRLIEERYNIKIKQIGVNDFMDLSAAFTKSIRAASDDFDLCMQISRDAWAAALKGYVTPVNNLPYLDITQPWYSQEVNSQLSINGNLFFAYSDECLNMFAQTICTVFNKKIVQDLDLENIYDFVRAGKWTHDKLFQLAKTATQDIDGDGAMTDTDRYGILSQTDFFYPYFWVGSGIKTVGKDENDLLVFTGADEKLYNILDRVYQNLFGGEKIFYDGVTEKGAKYSASNYDNTRYVSINQFRDNLGLFYITDLITIPYHLREMDADFGIIPFPKSDENQEKYYSRVIDGWINCVPNFAADLERTSIIMEALAVESKNTTVPAYFEVALQRKQTRDEESLEMLDIIYAGRTMDLGDTFYMNEVRNTYVGVFENKSADFVSNVEKRQGMIEKTLSRANETALALD